MNTYTNATYTKLGEAPTAADIDALSESFISREIAEAAELRRVSDVEGAEIVGKRRTANSCYSGIVYPYFLPPNYDRPREYRLRRDQPDLESHGDEIKERGKYLSPPGMRNMVYFPPRVTQEMLEDRSLPVVITEGEKRHLPLLVLHH